MKNLYAKLTHGCGCFKKACVRKKNIEACPQKLKCEKLEPSARGCRGWREPVHRNQLGEQSEPPSSDAARH